MIQPFLHMCHIGPTRPSYAAWIGIRRWAEACNPTGVMIPEHEKVHSLLWVDELAYRKMCVDVGKYFFFVSPIIQKFQDCELKICGYVKGRPNETIPILKFHDNLDVFHAKVFYKSGVLNSVQNAISFEANPQHGGIPLFAETLLSFLLLWRFGGVYVHPVGIDPKVFPITVSSIETNALQPRFIFQTVGKNIQKHSVESTRTAGFILNNGRTQGMVADCSISEVDGLLSIKLMSYGHIYAENPAARVQYASQIWWRIYKARDRGVQESMSEDEMMKQYLEALNMFHQRRSQIPNSEIAQMHSKKSEYDRSGWMQRPTGMYIDTTDASKIKKLPEPSYEMEDLEWTSFENDLSGMYRSIRRSMLDSIDHANNNIIPTYSIVTLLKKYAEITDNDFYSLSYRFGLNFFSNAPLQNVPSPDSGYRNDPVGHPTIASAVNLWEAAKIFRSRLSP